MTLLNTVNVGGTDYRYLTVTAIGSCDTPAGTEIKQVSFTDDFQLVAGVSVAVRFTYANTYGDGSTTYPKLQVNGTNYPIKTSTGSYAASGAWVNTQTVTLMFDGTGFVIANDAVYNNMVIKKDVTITTPSTIENDIKALGNELLSLVTSGTQTFSGLFFRTGVTFGSYTLTIRNASSCINGYVVIDNEQANAGMYLVTRVNNDWVIEKLATSTIKEITYAPIMSGTIYGDYGCSVQKCGNVITFHIEVVDGSTNNIDTVVYTLPVGYRPKTQRVLTLTFGNMNSISGVIAIYPSGNVNVNCSGGCFATLTYIAE